MQINNKLESISNIIVLMLLLMAAVSHQGKLFGKKAEELLQFNKKEQTYAEPNKEVLANAGFAQTQLNEVKKGHWEIRNEQNQVQGSVLHSSAFSGKLYGFGGPVPLYIFLDSENKIQKIQIIEHNETPEFMDNIRDQGIIAQWIGKTLVETPDIKADALSGATLSSNAINFGVQRSAQALDASLTGSGNISFNMKTILALLVILSGVFISFFAAGNKKLRILQLSLNTIILGFWCGKFISFQMLLNWTSSGINLLNSIVLVSMLVLAIFLPMLSKKKGFYCNWICPFGSAQELVGKIKKRKWNIPASAMKYLKHSSKFITLLLFFSMWLGMAGDIVDYEPFSAFLFRNAGWAVLSIAVLSIISSVFISRPWCRFVCPTGQILKWSNSIK